MSRIRTVKPELFKHEGLFAAEIATRLPLRLAFIGLLTCCDREGRFRWRPQRLKLDMLPYDDVIDIVMVLDALLTNNFIKQYEHQGICYGYIPSWSKHQQINHREAESDIPAPIGLMPFTNNILESNKLINDSSVTDACSTTAESAQLCPGIPGHARGEYGIWNREGNMEYGIGNMERNVVASVTRRHDDVAPLVQKIFQCWKKVMIHPDAKLDNKRKMLIEKALSFGYEVKQLCNAITGCSLTPHNMGDNDHSQRYDGLHIILRDADQIDRFIKNYHNPPQPIRDVDKRTQGNAHALGRWVNKKMQEGANDEKSGLN